MRIMRPLSQAVCLLKCMNVSINSMCMLHAQIVCPCNHDNQLRDCNRLQKKMAMSWRHSPNDAFPLMNATNQLKMASLSSFKQKLHNRFTLSGKRSFFLASSPSFSLLCIIFTGRFSKQKYRYSIEARIWCAWC